MAFLAVSVSRIEQPCVIQPVTFATNGASEQRQYVSVGKHDVDGRFCA